MSDLVVVPSTCRDDMMMMNKSDSNNDNGSYNNNKNLLFHFEGNQQLIEQRPTTITNQEKEKVDDVAESIGNSILHLKSPKPPHYFHYYDQQQSQYAATAATTATTTTNSSLLALPSSPQQQQQQQQQKQQVYFNDYEFYKSLCQQPNCIKVEIDSICIKHNHTFCQGIQVKYRSTFFVTDESNYYNKESSKNNKFAKVVKTTTTLGPSHLFAKGIYAVGKIYDTWLKLQPNEFIYYLKFYEGFVLGGIEFYTNNKRIVHIGGDCGGDVSGGTSSGSSNCNIPNLLLFFPSSLIKPNNHNNYNSQSQQEIIAFAGTACDILQRVGYYSKTTTATATATISSATVPTTTTAATSSSFHHQNTTTNNTTTTNRRGIIRTLPMFQFTDHRGYFGPKCLFVSSSSSSSSSPSQQEQQQELDSIINNNNNNTIKIWNDFSCYKSLCRRPGCKQVDISAVCIYYTTTSNDNHGEHNHHDQQQDSINSNSYSVCCCHGIEVLYRTTYWDGTIRQAYGPKHHFKRHYRQATVMSRIHHHLHTKWFYLDLDNGEYIKGIEFFQQQAQAARSFSLQQQQQQQPYHNGRASSTQQTTIQDIVLVTNHRVFSCCSGTGVGNNTPPDTSQRRRNQQPHIYQQQQQQREEGNWIRLFPPGRSMRIVAFAGILMNHQSHHRNNHNHNHHHGAGFIRDGGSIHLQRIGYYTTNMAWEKIGPFLLLRKLQQDGRATIILVPNTNDDGGCWKHNSNDEEDNFGLVAMTCDDDQVDMDCNIGRITGIAITEQQHQTKPTTTTLYELFQLPDGLFQEVLSFLY